MREREYIEEEYRITNMEEYLRTLQLKELDIAKALIDVCKKNNLKYYMVGGTLIGALRHQGFIPWDDDMDLAMPREDYEKFLNEYRKDLPDNIKIEHYKLTPDVYFYPLKLTDTNVKVVDKRLEKYGLYSNLSIDIFPIDGFPDKKIKQILYKIKYNYYRMLIGFCNIDNIRNIDRPSYQKAFIKFAKFTKIGKKMNLNKIRDKFDGFLKENTKKYKNIVGDITGAYGFKECVPNDFFGEGKSIKFEDIEMNAPDKYDEYLTQIYGDYMQIPPEENRKASHIKIVK